MGQKVNPHGLRVGVIKDWDSRWFKKDNEIGDTIVSDYKVRKYLKKLLYDAGIPKIEIERDSKRVRVIIHCAKPGLVIGRGGSEIDKLRLAIEKIVGAPTLVSVVEVKNPDLSAQLVAENIAKQIENRVAFRRAMKMSIQRTMRLGANGIKVSCGGRLGGAEIARSEHYNEGTVPLQTLRADIDYGFCEANTTYGKIGVKVWIYKGEVLAESQNRTRRNRDDRRNDRRERRNVSDNKRQGGFRSDDRRPNGNRRNAGDRRNGGGNGRGRADSKPVYYGGTRVPGYKPQDRNVKAEAPAAEPANEGGDN